MKKIACILLLCLFVVCGCQSGESNKISTDGSTSMEKVIGTLGEAYENGHDVRFTYNPTGSGAGIQAVSEGRCDIGLSSRELKDSEKSGLTQTVLAYDGIAVVLNPENPVSEMSSQTLADIYTGKITNWKTLGGADAPIVLIGREAGSGTRDGFEGVTDTKDKCAYRQELTSSGDVITTVASNPQAIGYTSAEAVKDSVKTVKIDGVLPEEQTIKNGSYALRRPFCLITRNEPLSEAAQGFYDFALSDEAAPLIVRAGAVPAQ